MKWEKLGLIFCPENRFDWMRTHAANPVAENRGGDLFRVYFSSRDEKNRASIGYVDIDIKEPTKVLEISAKPVLSPGDIGLFDDSGVSMGWILPFRGKRLLYYLGWNLGVTVPWRNTIGLAIADSMEGPFVKHSKAPMMDRSPEDPFSISYPSVIQVPNQHSLKMIYGSNLGWGEKQEEMNHVLKYAESEDGVHWKRNSETAIGFGSPGEYAMSKPSLLFEDGRYKAWFSYRGKAYRIGYAESEDGRHWARNDGLAGIDVSPKGWDSESVEYPFVFDHKGQRYLLYNGNRYGLTGFGIAALA